MNTARKGQNNGRVPYKHRTDRSNQRTNTVRTTSERLVGWSKQRANTVRRENNGNALYEHLTKKVRAAYANPHANNGARLSGHMYIGFPGVVFVAA